MFKYNQDERDRASIPHGPCDSVVNYATQLGVSLDDATLPPDVEVAELDLESLRDIVDAWINARKEEAAAVVDLDAEEGGDGDGGGGDGDGEGGDGDCGRGDGDGRGGKPNTRAAAAGDVASKRRKGAASKSGSPAAGARGGAARKLVELAASTMLLVEMTAIRPTGVGLWGSWLRAGWRCRRRCRWAVWSCRRYSHFRGESERGRRAGHHGSSTRSPQ